MPIERRAERETNENKKKRRKEKAEEETPSAPIKIPPPLHAALLAQLARFQAAPASVVSVSPSLVAFFKSAPWLFVAAALELRLSFALSVFIDALEMNTCNYCPPV